MESVSISQTALESKDHLKHVRRGWRGVSLFFSVLAVRASLRQNGALDELVFSCPSSQVTRAAALLQGVLVQQTGELGNVSASDRDLRLKPPGAEVEGAGACDE